MPRHRSTTNRIWLVVATAGALAVQMALSTSSTPIFEHDISISAPPWFLVAVAFYLAESTVIHLSFKQQAHSFSLSEIPLVTGLFFLSPLGLVGAQLTGSIVALATRRGHRGVRLAFSISQHALKTLVAVRLFESLVIIDDPLTDPLDPNNWMSAAVAAVAAVAVGNLLVTLAMLVSDQRIRVTETAEVFVLGSIAAATTTGLTLVALAILIVVPHAAWMASIPPVVLYGTYRAYLGQRQERARLGEMYEATRELHRRPQLDEALAVTVQRARDMFASGLAEIVLLPDGTHATGYLTVSTEEGDAVMQAISADDLDPHVLMAVTDNRGWLVNTSDRAGRNDVMVAPLFEEEDVIGAFMVRDPIGEGGGFTMTDLRLLETLAGQVSVSLENGRLEDSLAQVTELKEELRHQALHDALTGLANRTLLHERLESEIGRGRAALIFLDMDDFKLVNDSHGHAAGDELLIEVARRLVEACRPRDTIARLGGDEFAVLLPSTDRDEAERVAEEIIGSLMAPFDLEATVVTMHASLGVAHLESGNDADDLLQHADQAMYDAKNRRKGTYQVFEASLAGEARRRLELKRDLHLAIEAGGLDLHYQPIVDLTSKRPVGFEALLRWSHPGFGLVDPEEAVGIAEEAGLTDLLVAWTIGAAAADLAEWHRFDASLWVSVNVAAAQIDPELVTSVKAAIQAHGFPADRLTLEITESAAIQSNREYLDRIASMGVRIAIDDFGTGFSSLSRLDTLPITTIKIDRSFVNRMLPPDPSPVARMIIEIGDALDLITIGEGIETEEQRQALLDEGCHLGQGFLFSEPVEADIVTRRYQARAGNRGGAATIDTVPTAGHTRSEMTATQTIIIDD